MTFNTPEYYTDISRRLDRVLERIGLGEHIRWKRINMLIQVEELRNMTIFGDHVFHIFGSQAEATTTLGLQSDIDNVYCLPYTVLQDFVSWMPGVQTLLAVTDENTPAGYVKIQGVNLDQPLLLHGFQSELFKLDRYGRSFFSNDNGYIKFDFADEHHSPANTLNHLGPVSDNLFAVRMPSWPHQASQWLTRDRRHNWPSQEIIRLVQQTGAMLVPVGHTLSPEKHLEWRLSISYGEKLLMWLFNSTQYKCYILLKLLNKSFIKPVVGDGVLSSYHCKTCMFYLIENTQLEIWQPDNLLLCIELCLRLLYSWVDSKTCPNYFIPEENMFQCKVYGDTQCRLLFVLSDLLRQKGKYLTRISYDNIGHKLVMTCQTPLMELKSESQYVAGLLKTAVELLFCDFENSLCSAFSNGPMFGPKILVRIFFSQEPRREINIILSKFYCTFIGSKLASESVSQEIPDQHGLEMAHELLLWGSSSDVASGKLKLAAFYIIQENFDMFEDVINEIHITNNYKVSDFSNLSKYTLKAIVSDNLSTAQLISLYFAFPVFYHQSEINSTPKALIPDLFRSAGSDQGSPNENDLQKTKFVMVDPEFYQYFLEFLCYNRQHKRSHKNVALDNMICVIRHKNRIQYKDTALNVLAYCLMQEGGLMNAYNVLCKSMKLTKEHNAAKWQIATLVNTAFKFLRGSQ